MICQFQKAGAALVALLSVLASPGYAAAGKPTLASNPEDFPVHYNYNKNKAPHYPDFRGRDRAYAKFRTIISSGLKGGPNFAGKYSLTEFGCGSGGCVMGFVTDLTNGHVLPLPIGGEKNLRLDLDYHLDSRLISAHWVNDGRCMQQKFAITAGQFNASEVKDVGPDDAC